MFTYDQEMTDLIFDFCRWRLTINPVPLDFGGVAEDLGVGLEGLLNDHGSSPAVVLDYYDKKLATAIVSVDSPRFLSFIPAAPTKASLLFDMVVSASSLQGTSWLEAAGAIIAENQVLSLLAKQAGLDSHAGGCFVSGGSLGNLSALTTARDHGRRQHPELQGRRLRFAVSEEAHSSVAKALHVIDVDALVVPTIDHRLTLAALEAALAADPEPETVVGVVATGGTTNAGIIDDLEDLGIYCRAKGLWFHVDCAYGGGAMFSSTHSHLLSGLRYVDSFIVDPHKWLYAPFDCAALLYRDPRIAKATFTQNAAYLDIIHSDSKEEWNPTDYAMHLTRRARGLAIWFSLCVYGIKAYIDAVDDSINIANRAAAMIEDCEHLELVRDPSLSIVLFRRKGWSDQQYSAWSTQLLQDQIGFVTPTKWEGETIARFAFLHPETTEAMVAEILATMA
jgi:glutamate/tyrosine decarboxylase-like PLP-dependent enzyme